MREVRIKIPDKSTKRKIFRRNSKSIYISLFERIRLIITSYVCLFSVSVAAQRSVEFILSFPPCGC